MTQRILVVDDEAAIRDSVGYSLEREGWDVDAVPTGERALEEARARPYDAVVLDLMLPVISGLDVCRQLRAESPVPILMLTAKDAEVDRVLGLELGADDYLTKPFSMAELVSRVRAIFRRRELDRAAEGGERRRVGTLELDLPRHVVVSDGKETALTLSEFRLLELLSRRPENVYTREQIMQHLWSSVYVGDERACDAHVSNLRRKIEPDSAHPRRLLTVRGIGYKLMRV